MEDHTRSHHIKRVFGLWWAAFMTAWSALSSADTLVSHYANDQFKAAWDATWLAPKFGWTVWIVGALVITVIFVFEVSFRVVRDVEHNAHRREGDFERAMVQERAKHKSPDIRGELICGFIDTNRYNQKANTLEQLETGSYLSLFVRVVNHSECVGHPHKVECFATIHARRRDGTYESFPPYALTVSDPSIVDGRMLEFFRQITRDVPLERGIPFYGWMRFSLPDIGTYELSGTQEIMATVTVTIEDTLGGKHTLTSEKQPMSLKVNTISLSTPA